MRTLFRAILLALAAVVISITAVRGYRYLSNAEFTGSGLLLDRTLKRKEVYSIGRDNWLEFPVSGIYDALRVSSFARLQNKRADYQEDTEFFYTIEYQILDDQDQSLLHDTYQVRTFLPDLFYAANGEYTETKYLDGLIAPITAGKFFDLDLSALQNAHRIRLRIFETDNPIDEVLVRVLMHRQLREDQARLRWLRLGADKQRRITDYHVFPASLMTPREINDRVAQRWYPKAPTGTGFQTRTLYTRNIDEDDMFLEDIPLSIGRPIDATLRVTAIVPEATELDVSFKPTGVVTSGPFTATVRYWNHLLQQPTSYVFDLERSSPTLRKKFAPGFIEIETEASFQAVITSPTLEDGDVNLLYKLNIFKLDPRAVVTYSTHTPTNLNTDIRIDLRSEQFTPAAQHRDAYGSHKKMEPATYRIVDAAGSILSTGTLVVPTQQSAYDILIAQREWRPISDKYSYYLRLPKNTHHIELTGETNTYVSLYSRPSGLPLKRVVPKDYRTWEHRGGRIPSWFLMLPENDTELTLAARKQQITIQPRPPLRNVDILAGIYDWEEIAPTSNVTGKPVMVKPFHANQPREAAAGNFYASLKPGQPVALVASAGLATVTPTLLYHRSVSTAQTVTVKVDNKPLGNFFIQGRTGLLSLAPIPAGSHSFSISSAGRNDDTRWFINRCRCDFVWQQRFAYLFNGRNLVFDIEKIGSDRQNFTLVAFPASGGPQPTRINVAVEGLPPRSGPYSAWTFGETQFTLEARSGESEGFEMDHQARPLGVAQRLVVSLGEDVPAGRYRLRVHAVDGPTPLMQLYSIRAEPGVAQFFIEDL